MIHFKRFEDLTNLELITILKLRQDVFLLEQKIYEEDIDEYDKTAIHLYIKYNGEIVSYARLISVNGEPYVGRILTKKEFRHKGYATQIIEFVKSKYDVISISAQVYLIDYYRSLDFRIVGRKYKEAGIDHQKMVYIK